MKSFVVFFALVVLASGANIRDKRWVFGELENVGYNPGFNAGFGYNSFAAPPVVTVNKVVNVPRVVSVPQVVHVNKVVAQPQVVTVNKVLGGYGGFGASYGNGWW